MSEIKNIKLKGTNVSLEEIKKIRYNGDEHPIGGGSSSTPVDNGAIYEGKYRVRYFDTDGTILKIEYVEEGGKTTPPTAPAYDPDYLIFAEWNYDTDNYIVEQPTDIGAIYDTVGGLTYMFCRFTTNTGLNPTLKITGATSIDWGDGTVDTNLSHTYTKEGEYIIKIYGDISFTVTASNYLFGRGSLNRVLQKCYIKNGVTKIGDYVFSICYNLTNISIPKSVTSIASYAFASCYSLKSITIPKSVTSIGSFAFYNCFSLINYFINCDTVPTLSNTAAFNGINESAIMWIKDSKIEQLKVATNWSTYAGYMKPLSWYPSLTDPNA